MTHSIVLIPGDGIGPEVTDAARRVLDATGVGFDWQVHEAGGDVIPKYGKPLPDETLDAIKRTRLALKGPITTPIGSGFPSVNVALRKALDVYANFRPSQTQRGVQGRYENVDLIVVRENTEGLYSGLEHEVVPGVVESLRIVTEKGSERILRFAFQIARERGRKKVTVVHKANILKLSDGLFLRVARSVAEDYPEIELEEAIIDATAMKLVLDPTQFDVLVMENLFGDIVSDLTAGLVGGIGLTPSANIGENAAIFEAVHGSAPDIAGQGLANPTALIFAGVLMLRHLGESAAADRVNSALCDVLADGQVRTGDIGGSASTREFTDAVIARLG